MDQTLTETNLHGSMSRKSWNVKESDQDIDSERKKFKTAHSSR